MIGHILEVIAKECNLYINKAFDLPAYTKSVVVKKPQDDNLADHTISLSLIGIEEELSMKNTLIKKEVIDGKVYKQNPPVNINLQVMFVSNYKNDYLMELNAISKIIEFFQQKPQFSKQSQEIMAKYKAINLTYAINTIPLKDQASVWGLVGGKYLPSIIYKIGIITVQDDLTLIDTKLVSQVDIDVHQGV